MMKLVNTLFFILAVANAIELSALKRISFPTGRVVGGSEATPHSAPFIVSLQTTGLFGGHFCAGSIIAANWVLSAGHCLYSSPSQVLVVAGMHNLNGKESTVQKRNAMKFVVNELYSGNVGPYDVGLIYIKESFQFNDVVQPVALPEPNFIHSGEVILFGWGSTSTGSFPILPRKLQNVKKPIIKFANCMAIIPNSPLHDTNLCTGPLSGGISACSGDSGGPLVQNNNGTIELVGIVSWGYVPCGQPNAPSVYTRTSAHIDWIHNHQARIEILNKLQLI